MLDFKLKLEILEKINEVFESKESLKKFICEKYNITKSDIDDDDDLNGFGICEVISEFITADSINFSGSLYQLYELRYSVLMELGVERKFFDDNGITSKEFQYWYENYEDRKQAIDENWKRFTESEKYENYIRESKRR